MDKELLRNLQLKEMEIIWEIERICKKHHIEWMLAYGSVLGAVRHGGFIPWDDDIDICMTADEYDRFLKVCKTELNKKKFFLQMVDTDKNYSCPWAKIRMNNTCSMDEEYRDKKMHWGICVDIFRMQYAPKDEADRKKMKRLFWIYSGVCGLSFEERPSLQNVGECLKYVFRKVLRTSMGRKMMEKKLDSYSRDTDKKFMWDNSECKFIPARFFEKTEMRKFEEDMLPCTNSPEEYCDFIYGDWKTFPPEDKRYGHAGIIVDLNKSYTEYMK